MIAPSAWSSRRSMFTRLEPSITQKMSRYSASTTGPAGRSPRLESAGNSVHAAHSAISTLPSRNPAARTPLQAPRAPADAPCALLGDNNTPSFGFFGFCRYLLRFRLQLPHPVVWLRFATFRLWASWELASRQAHPTLRLSAKRRVGWQTTVAETSKVLPPEQFNS